MLAPVGVAAVVSAPLTYDSEDVWAWASAPTVTVTDATGTALSAPSVDGSSPYDATLNSTSHTHRPDVLTVTWTGTVAGAAVTTSTVVEVVSALPADLVDLQGTPSTAADGDLATARLKAFRQEFLDLCDEYLHWSPVRRLRSIQAPAYARTITLDRDNAEVRKVTDPDGTTVTGWEQDGPVVDLGVYSSDPLTVWFVHGADSVPRAARQACVEYVRASANAEASGVQRDAITVAYDGATTRYSTADRGARRITGYLVVDRLLNQLPNHAVPHVA